MNWGITIGAVYFNSVDIIIFLVMMVGAVGGCMVGFIESFSRTAGYVVGLFSGLMFTTLLADTLMESFGISLFFASLAAFIILFMVGFVGVLVLAGILHRFVRLWAGLTAIDMLLGFLWGMLAALAIIALVCHALRMQTLLDVDELFRQSQFVTRFIDPHLPEALNLVKGAIS